MLAAGKLHRDVRAARVLRRLFDDGSPVGARRRRGSPLVVAKRSRVREGSDPRRKQDRPCAQPIGIDRRYDSKFLFFFSPRPSHFLTIGSTCSRKIAR